jgi:hypothetical protein
MRPRPPGERAPDPTENRARFSAHTARLEQRAQAQARLLAERKLAAQSTVTESE